MVDLVNGFESSKLKKRKWGFISFFQFVFLYLVTLLSLDSPCCILMLNGLFFLLWNCKKSKVKKQKQWKGLSQRIEQKRRDMSCTGRLTKKDWKRKRGWKLLVGRLNVWMKSMNESGWRVGKRKGLIRELFFNIQQWNNRTF